MRVAVAVPCTDRKRGGTPQAMLRSIDAGLEVPERVAQWTAQLLGERERGPSTPLRDLYAGPGWTASMDMVSAVEEALEQDVDDFVLSAGLGLQGLQSGTRGWPRYSATFAGGHPDSVVHRDARDRSTQRWWSELSRSEPLGATTFVELAASYDAVLVVASAPYLRAASEDLIESARAGLRVVGFTASVMRQGDLEQFLVRLDARTRSIISASDARATADFIAFAAARLGDDLLDVTAARAFVDRTLEGRVAPPRPRGLASSPEEVRSFIYAALQQDPRSRKGRLLRQWRDQGRSFEQRRFGALFDDVVASMREAGTDPRGVSSHG